VLICGGKAMGCPNP